MNSLTLAQIRRFNDAVLGLHADVVRDDFEAAVVVALERLVPAEVSGVGLFDGRTGRVSGSLTPAVGDTEVVSANFNRLSHQHPAIGRRARQARSISQYLSRAEWHRRELYADVFRPFGMEDDLGLEVDLENRVFLFVARMRTRRDFTREDRLLLGLLGPHLRTAWQQAQAVRCLPLPRAVEHELGAGMVEVNESGRVLACGALSNDLLRSYFGVAARSGELPGELRGWFRSQRHAIAAQPFRARGAAGGLTVRYVKDTDGARYFLLLHERRLAADSADAAKLEVLGLSHREQEVLYWVAQGKTNGEVAGLLGISPGTVKRHLENIYAALGVENRHGATLRALRCLEEPR